jgi:DNA repair protein RadC
MKYSITLIMKKNRHTRVKPGRQGKDVLVFGLGLIPKEGVPEIKIRYTRSPKVFLGKVSTSKDVAVFIRKIYPRGTLQLQEQVFVIYLNNANEILGYYRHTVGTITSTIADVRLIMATALLSVSVAIIMAHNHPSGKQYPSAEDIDFTNRVKAAGQILNVTLLDHIIITRHGYYSFSDNGML